MACHAKYLRDRPSSRITLQGHTDERGSRAYNQALGERRGNGVNSALQANGGSASQLTVVSYGEERPVCTESNESCWSQNRRVEIVYTAHPRGFRTGACTATEPGRPCRRARAADVQQQCQPGPVEPDQSAAAAGHQPAGLDRAVAARQRPAQAVRPGPVPGPGQPPEPVGRGQRRPSPAACSGDCAEGHSGPGNPRSGGHFRAAACGPW
ncbi:hypothetical protein G6F50_013462 [Rhizopus delemar]|uniref:OmpA-like domain-containing protein n=1 Tax=Rhizopus delemar TaxID=936053 RepID=A0A9P7CDL6_9FUNG|nr:hypothetical protein G6F50_013462 [Rhizopus delemar]